MERCQAAKVRRYETETEAERGERKGKRIMYKVKKKILECKKQKEERNYR